MYHQHHLDSQPPASQFRRPWSPEPFDPNPSDEPYRPLHSSRTLPFDSDYDYSRYPQARREPSDVSVEALDLADYAATLRRNPYPDYPPASHHSSDIYSSPRSHRHNSMPPQASDAGIDTSRFPLWSQHWYDNPSRLPPSNDYDSDIYSPPPQRSSKNYFDPSHTIRSPQYGASSPPPFSPPPPFSSSAHDSLVPWSLDPPDVPVDHGTKEERIRMLEREFAGAHPAFESEEKPETLVGTADAKGNLITQGPRKRIAFRITQILLALAAAIPAIYAALAIKPTVAPTPSGTPAAYVLYVISCITFLGLFFYFAIRPCFRKRPKHQQEGIPGLAGMVLPAGGGQKKKKKGKKGYPQQQDVHVNLIVDPSMFRPAHDDQDEDWEGSTAVSSSAGGRKRGPKRKSIMASLLEERLWVSARSRAKKILCLDILLSIVWLAVFIYIMFGKRCAAGTASNDSETPGSTTASTSSSLGSRAILHLVSRALAVRGPDDDKTSSWCMAWNVSSAAACLLAVVSGVCAFFGVKDLGASRVNPRKR